jgi:hypothetical protein
MEGEGEETVVAEEAPPAEEAEAPFAEIVAEETEEKAEEPVLASPVVAAEPQGSPESEQEKPAKKSSSSRSRSRSRSR